MNNFTYTTKKKKLKLTVVSNESSITAWPDYLFPKTTTKTTKYIIWINYDLFN